MLAGVLAVVSTYLTFSGTFDEPKNLAAGMEWLSAGRYTYDPQQPPLGRIAAAIGPTLQGERWQATPSPLDDEGAKLLGRGPHYRTTLALARFGELPFLLLLCGIVWLWGRRLTDERGAAIAVLLTTTNPNVLAHAGLATTDIALTATLTAALFAYVAWFERPVWWRSALLGLGLAAAVVSKFSALGFFVVAMLGIWLARRVGTQRTPIWSEGAGWRGPLAAAIALIVAGIVVWGIYRFDVGPLVDGSTFAMPAPQFLRGIVTFVRRGASASPAFLLGELSADGWWYYFPVALLVKTPLPLLLLSVIGAGVAVRALVRHDTWQLASLVVAVAAILGVAAAAQVDTGVRLVLPVYPLLALLGAVGAVELWERGAATVPARRLVRSAVVATIAGAILVPLRVQPDHLAYFNPLAGENPEKILVDSNLDWGQDLYRLGATMKRMRIDSVRVAYFGSATFDAAGVRNARPFDPTERPTGWIAASQTVLAGAWADNSYDWLNELRPVGRVGASLVLYYVPPKPRRLSARR